MKKNNFSVSSFLFFLFPLLLNLLNTYFIHSNILASISLIMGVMAILNFFLDKSFSIHIFWLNAIFCMMLPVKEYFQIFLGVPMRLFSADILEKVFHFLNINISQFGSILLFENNVTNIDVPCSGSLTIYYSLIFIFVISFLSRVEFDVKWCIKAFFTLFLASFLNTFRIFILVFCSILGLSFVADNIHILLGAINYFIVCLLFCFLTRKKAKVEIKNINVKYPFILALAFIIFLSFPIFLAQPSKDVKNEFILIKENKNNLDFSEKEISLFRKYGSIVEKYLLDDKVIIKIKAKNFLGLHNPILCLKAQGFEIIKSETLVSGENLVHFLETNKGYIYFYFSNQDKTLDDYYRVAFELFLKKEITLVIIYSKEKLNIADVLKI